MFKLPKKFVDRVTVNLKKYQAIVSSQRTRDVSEADTVTAIKDILADIFGYDKFIELTSEHQVRGTFCDLAVQIDGKVKFLIEAKSAGVELNENHIRQAINYGVNKGIEWILLTNALEWRLYNVQFTKPVEFEEVTSFKLSDLNLKNPDDLQKLFLLAREGLYADAVEVYHQKVMVLNKYIITQMLLSEPVVNIIRREMKRLFPEVKIDASVISNVIQGEIVKREVIEGDKTKEAQSKLKRAANKLSRLTNKEVEVVVKAEPVPAA